jgi:hypothetical protein
MPADVQAKESLVTEHREPTFFLARFLYVERRRRHDTATG